MLEQAKSTLAAEQYVFNELKRTHFRRLTPDEIKHAEEYIKKVQDHYNFWLKNAK